MCDALELHLQLCSMLCGGSGAATGEDSAQRGGELSARRALGWIAEQHVQHGGTDITQAAVDFGGEAAPLPRQRRLLNQLPLHLKAPIKFAAGSAVLVMVPWEIVLKEQFRGRGRIQVRPPICREYRHTGLSVRC